MRRRSVARLRQAVLLAIALVVATLSLSSHARRTQVADAIAAPADPVAAEAMPSALPASGFVWMPQLSPRGPLVIVVSLPDQRASVYRNGVRIGLSRVSTGRPGFETPTGVFTILQKDREHYSNVYDNAPMPFMQRLTWDGVAMHAGQVPDAPASHGCVRLPYAFSEALFAVTERGMTVIVSDVVSETATAAQASPGIAGTPPPAAPVVVSGAVLPVVGDAAAAAHAAPPAPTTADMWTPERSPAGPLAVVASIRDGEIRVMRNAIEIGRARMTASPGAILGTRAYVLLDGAGAGIGLVADRPALRWLEVPLIAGSHEQPIDLHALAVSGALATSPSFARAVYDALLPGSSLVVTDQPLGPLIHAELAILTADQPQTPAEPSSPRAPQ